jgi:hypothetical protein
VDDHRSSVVPRHSCLAEEDQEVCVIATAKERLWMSPEHVRIKGGGEVWSDPPIVAMTALMEGSAKAACKSRARSATDDRSTRVVGYSTGTRLKSSRSRSSPKLVRLREDFW